MPPRRRRPAATHTKALAAALADLNLGPADDAAVRLAHEYAALLDVDPLACVKVGSHYLAVLAALGLTPAARAAVAKGGEHASGVPGADDLARLRAGRAAAR